MTLEELFAASDAAPLAAVPAGGLGAAIKRRRLDEVHACAFCAVRASAAVYLRPNDLFGAARWLDMCWQHFGELRDLGAQQISDPETIRRYEAWRKQAAR